MKNLLLAFCAATLVSGCVVKNDPPVSDAVLAQSVYRHEGPTKLTLFTMVNNRTGRGAHASLMINGSQRVIFDPAGSFRWESIITRGDVVYGVTPKLADVYTRFHARETFHVIVQELQVSPDVAEKALQMALARGEVPDAYCARSTSEILASLPGFQSVSPTWYPLDLSEQFAQLPGVTSSTLYEYDDADRFKALEAYDAERVRANMVANGY